MPKYLYRSTYTPEGAQRLAEEGGTARTKAAKHLVESLGGKLEAFYFAFGTSDSFLILDLPDNIAAAAWAAAVKPAGGVSEASTTVLLTPSEIDEATRAATGYQPPGRPNPE